MIRHMGVIAIAGPLALGATWLHRGERATESPPATIDIPHSIKAEHEAIHALLEEATKAPGRTGEKARVLAVVLHPHFVREEQIALPPLGLLRALAAGELPPGAPEALAMTDSLRRELPAMLDEHKRIARAVVDLHAAAESEGAAKYAALADDLADHARTEEEVLYPAAVLVGDVLRARMREK